MRLSIIIPTLNEERALPDTLLNVAACAPGCEVIVADGGSADRTKEIALGGILPTILWLDAPRGRGNQMNAAAARAAGDVLLFLHADSQLPPDTPRLITDALSDPRIVGGNFRIQFVPRTPLADVYTWCYNLRTHLRIFYGDSALFVRREVFERLGGYRAALLMEDIEFLRRLRRTGWLAYIRSGTVTTSTRRFPGTLQGVGMLFVWMLLHALLACGVRQEILERLYPEIR
ncbi:MAG TPA: TIGR04283 family arsenosugar biosynthesis glycosyltransferase [Chthonomonadaceae bacterium]|nr:TIGR04283 family arsenosugar biosynthesis glycosyltransferase [Chthonomonadaceae bacterium]